MKKKRVQFKLNITADLKRKLEAAAKENDRSANAEAVARLIESLQESVDRYRHSEIMTRLDVLQRTLNGDFDGF